MARKLFGSHEQEPSTGGGYGWEEDYEDGEGDEPDEFESLDKAGLIKAVQAERKRATEAKAEAAKLAKAAEDRQAAADAAEKKRQEEAGEFVGLYETAKAQLEVKGKRLADLEAKETARAEKLTASNAERVKALAPEWQDLVPAGLDADDLADWLGKAEKKAAGTQARGTRTRGGGQPQIPAECAENARQHKRTPEAWFPIWLNTPAGKKWAEKANYQP